MIFFTENIGSWIASNGRQLNPISCELKTGEVGYYLGSDWAIEVVSKVSTIKVITKDDIKEDIA